MGRDVRRGVETGLSRGYGALFDSVLTHADAERAHQVGFAAIRAARPATTMLGRRRLAGLGSVRVWDLDFPGRLGLAAGFDKNGVGIDALAALGFGHVEIGTVTGEAQPGNPRPRLFRLPADRAVVNRMGFNNDGAEVVARRLADRVRRVGAREAGSARPVVGVNIGKTKAVPDDAAVTDYVKSAWLLAPYADYLVVNVSSPNTPGLRDLQAVARLEPLLNAVRDAADQASPQRRVPLLVKIAPDLTDEDVVAVADLTLAIGLDGVVATNTTISRDGLRSPVAQVEACGAGGLSGPVLRARSSEVLGLLRARLGDLPLIGVGGIDSPAEARRRLAAGATLVQAYTGFIYGGPTWPGRVQRAISVSDGRQSPAEVDPGPDANEGTDIDQGPDTHRGHDTSHGSDTNQGSRR